MNPVHMNIGYRFNEQKRAISINNKLNSNGLSLFKASFGFHEEGRHKGKRKWESVPWRKPKYPLINDGIYKEDIIKFWKNKPIRFAPLNNCVGCFHRSPQLLKKMSVEHPNKFQWFASQEGKFGSGIGLGKGTWKKNISYSKIAQLNFSAELDFESEGCNSGFCGM